MASLACQHLCQASLAASPSNYCSPTAKDARVSKSSSTLSCPRSECWHGLAAVRVAASLRCHVSQPNLAVLSRATPEAFILRAQESPGRVRVPAGKLPTSMRRVPGIVRERTMCNMTPAVAATGEEPKCAPTSESTDPLFYPHQLGPYELKHRVALAPLTRCRSVRNVPQPPAVEYYSQRASHGGLMISEGTVISETGHGYPQTPGIYTDEQVTAWTPIVDAVHSKGAIFFCQIWHVGRASHPHYQPNGALPISPTEGCIPPSAGRVWLGGDKRVDFPERNHALTREEIQGVVQDYRLAARNAIRAGFDGVEIHGAHAYLIDEFLKETVNDRTDEYGGSLENRCRFALEVVDAVIAEVGAHRTAIRLSPFSTFMGASTEDPVELGVYMAKQLSDRGVIYLHCVEPRMNGQTLVETSHVLDPIRKAFKGSLVSAGGYEGETAREAVANGHADIIAFGRKFLANPDLPKRLLLNAPLNDYDRSTFYTPDFVVGYTDYPFLEDMPGKTLTPKL